MLDSVETRIETALEDDAERGVYRVAGATSSPTPSCSSSR